MLSAGLAAAMIAAGIVGSVTVGRWVLMAVARRRWGANPAQATAGVVLYSLYVHFLEVPLGLLGWVGWWLSPKTVPADRTA